MQNLPKQTKVNPLAGLMRQPKIYIKLPSQGMFWPDGSLAVSENGEYPVYSMTAKDELLLKNPATQSGGQALVDVIQSCIPNIKDAWSAPGLDLDTILIAIRVATYGPAMKVPVTANEVTSDYDVNLVDVLDSILKNAEWAEQLALDNGMIVFLHPLPYKAISKAGVESIETQKIFNLVNNEKIDDDKKIELFKESFVKLTDITIGVVADSISKIITSDNQIVENPKYIGEFLDQCDRDIFNVIRNRINELTSANAIKSILTTATEEMVAAGAPAQIEVPIVFKPETFFQ